MILLPVLDLAGGAVVRGVGGRRSEYRPVVSRLTRSAHPFDVAAAFRDHFGLAELYLADLDGIAGGEPAFATIEGLCERGFGFWVDLKRSWPEVQLIAGGGVRGVDDLKRLRQARVDGVLVASALHDGAIMRQDVWRHS